MGWADPVRHDIPSGAKARQQQLSDWRQITWILYVLLALAPLTAGLSAVAAVVVNHVKQAEVASTPFESHFRSQRQMFWRSLVWLTLGFLTMWWHYLGLVFFLGGLGWYVLHLVRGLIYLNAGKPLPRRASMTLASSVPSPTSSAFP